jgi:HEAT repeat protein
MFRRFLPVLVLALVAGACSAGASGPLGELLEQVRLDDPLADRTYQQNQEAIETTSSIPILLDHLANDPSPKVRQWCALILGRIGDPQAVPGLTAALSDTDGGTRERAAVALGQIGEDVAEDAFIEALEGGSRDAKMFAMIELEKNASVKAIPAIAALARADDALISRNATNALGGINDPSAVAPLAEIAVDSSLSEPLRRQAIMNLGRISAPEARTALQGVAEQLGQQEGAEALAQLARDTLSSG